MELIKVENGLCVLSEETSQKLAELEARAKEIKEVREQILEALKTEMEAKTIIKLDTPEVAISYIQPTYRETFDAKQFRAENEELYNKYIKISNVASSVRIKVK